MLNDDPVDILVVEDNDEERACIVEALKAAIENVQVAAVHDGKQALDFLFAHGTYAERAAADCPRLIMLDMQLPGSDGYAILGQIRLLEPQSAQALIPVVIFSDSQAASDITRGYRCGANSYITKPVSYPDFLAIVESIGRYWITHNKAPA
ncbi:MAG: response regulator [Candidatus Hydrogenedentota bacterium]